MPDEFKDHFSAHSADYSSFRPTYPTTLVQYLGALTLRRQRALDCGCGSGQLSGLLTSEFAEVIAIDASQKQIDNAVSHDRVLYRRSRAEDCGLEDSSVDLVTVAQAAHWFELDAFYHEVRRVLRPGGVVALITYGVIDVRGEVGRVLAQFYFDVIGSFWPPERMQVESGYRTLPFPFREILAPAMAMSAQWSAAELLGYVKTWSAVRNAEQSLGGAPIARFAAQLLEVWGEPARRRNIVWPLNLRVGFI